MYLCTSIIQYIVTYRHKKLRKFDKKIQAFQGLRKIFIYSTVKEPCVASKFGRPSKKGETQENKAKSYTRPLLKPVNRARINTNKCLDYIKEQLVKARSLYIAKCGKEE